MTPGVVPVNVTGDPGQTMLGLADPAMTGNGFTVTVTVDVAVQPAAEVPVTVYVVVVVGATFTLEPVKLPGCQLYDKAPLAVKLVEPPLQIAAEAGDMLTEGSGLMVTALVATRDALVHPVVELVTCA